MSALTKASDDNQTIYLKDYRAPDYLISKTSLNFILNPDRTEVASELTVTRVPASGDDAPLILHGQMLELLEVCINGERLSPNEYILSDDTLTLSNLPSAFVLSIRVAICPEKNTALEGLYRSAKMYCTQCEAEGFRKITYYYDRPDSLSEFKTRIEADKSLYPVLLSNGNKVGEGELVGGRHWVEWHDPHLKPCYLFALVAGDLQRVDDTFTTMNGRKVDLQIFVESKDLDKCDHAMQSLKNSMRWDEEVYGLSLIHI